jgi:hypothetical protein
MSVRSLWAPAQRPRLARNRSSWFREEAIQPSVPSDSCRSPPEQRTPATHGEDASEKRAREHQGALSPAFLAHHGQTGEALAKGIALEPEQTPVEISLEDQQSFGLG